MLDEFTKSTKAILYERIVSPLSGAFFFSWIIWNWKLIFYILFSDYDNDLDRRIKYIESNFIHGHTDTLIIFPIISAVLIVTIYPIFSTLAYWIFLQYKKRQNDIKNKFEDQKLLTVQQSVQLRSELKKFKNQFHDLNEEKDIEIKTLKSELELSQNEKESMRASFENDFENLRKEKNELEKKYNESLTKLNNANIESKNFSRSAYFDSVEKEQFDEFIKTNYSQFFKAVASAIVSDSYMGNAVSNDVITYYVVNDLIKKTSNTRYDFTDKGKRFYQEYLRNSK